MPRPTPRMIPLADCKPRWLYYVPCRNFSLGVFHEEEKGFIGLREKFGSVFLATEYHWDTGAPYGTAVPIEALEPIPDDMELSEGSTALREWMFAAVERHLESLEEKNKAYYDETLAR